MGYSWKIMGYYRYIHNCLTGDLSSKKEDIIEETAQCVEWFTLINPMVRKMAICHGYATNCQRVNNIFFGVWDCCFTLTIAKSSIRWESHLDTIRGDDWNGRRSDCFLLDLWFMFWLSNSRHACRFTSQGFLANFKSYNIRIFPRKTYLMLHISRHAWCFKF